MNLEAVDLNLMVALGHLLERQSVTLAAAEAGVTQPTMSHSLSRLRDLLGDPLLVRVGRNMVRTERAEALRPKVQSALAATRAVLESDEVGERPSFRVTMSGADDVLVTIVGPLLAELRTRAPDIDFFVKPVGPDTLQKLDDGSLDLVVAPLVHVGFSVPEPVRRKLDALTFEALFDDELICTLRPDHPRGAGPMTLEELTRIDHLLVAPGGGEIGTVDHYLTERGLHRRIAATTWTFLSGVHMLLATDLMAFLPRSMVEALPIELMTLAPPLNLPKVPIGIYFHPRRADDRRLGWVRERIHEIAARRA
jgi:DNA-binding transcriptional LysR family regulator